MIVDALREITDADVIISDVCIVGSGPAGLTLAVELASIGLEVVVLEADGTGYSKESQDFFRGEIVGRDNSTGLHEYRHRRLGGTSKNWGGRCLMYDPIDFETRDFVPESGWPIKLDTLIPYYRRALRYCEAGKMIYDAASALPNRIPEMIQGLPDGDIVTSTIERWSPPTDFGRRYLSTLRVSGNLRVLLNSACVCINLDQDRSNVVSLTVRAGMTKSFLARARVFVLAAGGLEVPRLLLSSKNEIPNGIGNYHDLVGRYYMTHLNGVISTAHLSVDGKHVSHGYERDIENIYVRRRISISPAAQKRERLPNFTALFHHPPVADPCHRSAILSAVFIAKNMRSIRHRIPPGLGIIESDGLDEDLRLWLRHIRNLLIDSPALLGFLPWFAYRRFLNRRRIPSVILPFKRAVFPLHYHVEQTPNPESRVLLSEERDSYGVPRIRLDFRVNQFDVDGIVRAHKLLDNYLRKYKIGHIVLREKNTEEAVWRNIYPTNGHFIGTTRMADDPRKGVVDPDCKVFGVGNLFIASSAVFPTSSHANPTLTIVALATRLADHLRVNFQRLAD